MIKLIDYVRIAPDPSLYSLSKKDKIVLIDSALNRQTRNGLIITYDLSHSTRRINNRVYSVAGQQKGINSLLTPYPKPILQHHDSGKDPIGRFIGGSWEDLSHEAVKFFDNVQDFMKFKQEIYSDEPNRIYKALKKRGLLGNRNWPGLGRMRVQAKINDKEAIEKFLDGRYITFSAGSTTDRHVCSICDSDWAKGDMCEHRHGRSYDGETCVFLTGAFKVLEGSVVNMPADDLSQIQSMELLSDSVNDDIVQDTKIDKECIYLSDSIIKFEKEVKMKNDETSENSNENEVQVDESKEQSTEETKEVVETSEEFNISDSVMEKIYEYVAEKMKQDSVEVQDEKEKEEKEVESKVTGETIETKDKEADEVEENKGSDGAEVRRVQSDVQNGEAKVGDVDGDIVNIIKDAEPDWYLLDAALAMEVGDKKLTAEAREKLPDSVFCGPERSFPVPDCAHVTAARRLIGKAKLSDDQKKKVLSCVSKRADSLSCGSEADTLLQSKYDSIVSDLKEEIEKLKNKINNIETRKEEIKKDSLKPIESPSVGSSDQSSPTGENVVKSLGSYEKKVVDKYSNILNSDGEIAAENYFSSKMRYLPKGFHPKKYIK